MLLSLIVWKKLNQKKEKFMVTITSNFKCTYVSVYLLLYVLIGMRINNSIVYVRHCFM